MLGVAYDAIRNLVHDHGGSPERALFLLVPLALGCLLAAVMRRSGLLASGTTRFQWLRAVPGSTLVVAFLLMLPTAYFYGARRGVAFFAACHSMASQQATAMLSELVLVIFGTCAALMAMPTSKALRPVAEELPKGPRLARGLAVPAMKRVIVE
jgi:hypothetical protein